MPLSSTVSTQAEAERCMALAQELLDSMQEQDIPPCAVMVILTVALQIMAASMDATMKTLHEKLQEAKTARRSELMQEDGDEGRPIILRQRYDA